MLLYSRSVSSSKLCITSTNPYRSKYLGALGCLLLLLALAASRPVQAQTSAGPAQDAGRIIVKIKPALAQEAEAQLLSAAQPAQPMQVRAGQARSARIESFLRRHSARQLAPMYPGMLRAKKQHGWSDAQMAEHIRQRFAVRAHRTAHPTAIPEISRTYILEVGNLSAQREAPYLAGAEVGP